MGLIDLVVAQAGIQTDFNTAASSTSTNLYGITSIRIHPIVETTSFPNVQGLAPAYNAAVIRTGAEASIEGIVLYEDFVAVPLQGLFGTSSTSGTGPLYSRTYSAPNQCAGTPEFRTIYIGEQCDTAQDYKMIGAIPNTLRMTATGQGAWTYSSDYIGKSVATATLNDGGTPASRITNPVTGVHIYNASAGSPNVYLGGFGTAYASLPQLANCMLIDFELNVGASRTLKHYLGNVSPCGYIERRWTGSLKMTLEFNSTTDDYLNAILADLTTPYKRKVRIQGILANVGTVQVDFAGVLADAPQIWTDTDGVSSIELTFNGLRDETAALAEANKNWLVFTVSNTLATIP